MINPEHRSKSTGLYISLMDNMLKIYDERLNTPRGRNQFIVIEDYKPNLPIKKQAGLSKMKKRPLKIDAIFSSQVNTDMTSNISPLLSEIPLKRKAGDPSRILPKRKDQVKKRVLKESSSPLPSPKANSNLDMPLIANSVRSKLQKQNSELLNQIEGHKKSSPFKIVLSRKHR